MVIWLMHSTSTAADNNYCLQEITAAMKETKSKRLYLRYQVVFLHLKGYTNKEIAGMVGLCQHTVGIYVNAYKAEGIAGLVMGKSTGAPKFLTTVQEQQLFSVITTQTPDQVGIHNRKNWDTPAARQWVKENFAVEYSARGMLKVLHRLNLSYTRPTYTLAKADPHKQEVFKAEFTVLKKPSCRKN